MLRPLPEWRARHLWTAWIAYWVIAFLAWIVPAIPLLWRIFKAGAHGTVSLSANDGVVSATVTSGAQVWVRSLSYGALTLLLVIPPLLLWLAWVIARPRRRVA